MIGKLKGIVDFIDKDNVIIDVNGVGYIVFCSPRTLRHMPTIGEIASLIIETHVREDNISLYGFKDHVERDWFRNLTSVKGVGTKVAFAILGAQEPDKIALAIAAADRSSFNKVSGVGPKLAERIITELKDKTNDLHYATETTQTTTHHENQVISDLISALNNLGYNRADVFRVAHKLGSTHPDSSLGELIKLSLREFS
jgi:Holliday junction DNA helicase RuvA